MALAPLNLFREHYGAREFDQAYEESRKVDPFVEKTLMASALGAGAIFVGSLVLLMVIAGNSAFFSSIIAGAAVGAAAGSTLNALALQLIKAGQLDRCIAKLENHRANRIEMELMIFHIEAFEKPLFFCVT